jgi:hypothetical protein
MQELYNQKMKLKDGIKSSESKLNEIKLVDYPLKTNEHKYILNTVSAYEKNSINKKSPDEPTNEKSSIVSSNNSIVAFERENQVANLNKPFDNEKKKDYSDIDFRTIEHMWDNFNIDEYEENIKSVDSNKKFVKNLKKEDAKSIAQRPMSAHYEWAPRVTIPKPFSMTIREKIKSDKKKQKLIREMEHEREKKADSELKECNRKFKANSVPIHVQLPLYEKIRLEDELRKRKLKRISQDYMKKVVKPFNLSEPKRLIRSNSYAGELNHSIDRSEQRASSVKNELKKFEFTAKPLPAFYYEDDHLKNEK